MKQVFVNFRRILCAGILLLVWEANTSRLHANPAGGTVAQGTATINPSGSQLTINQASANAVINWQSFNIGAGETTTFVQPSSTSVAWNQINDVNPSQILGNLNANGYVVLQNSSGFYVGGQASITVHGLIMTTASTPVLNLSSGGPWSFNAPPPMAKIINYGQINIVGGGSAFLIANDIENNGTISAPGGKIGLYAGQTVLVSTSPDGRGLSAQATIPQGLVDNEGNLIADAGSISLRAQMVNQNGLIQANSAQEINGTIELVAGDSVSLGANSTIAATGDSTLTTPSGGGSVTIQAGNSFFDQTGSAVDVSGGAQGGNGGWVEISATRMGAIKSRINGGARDGFSGGILTIDPANIWLASADADPAAPADYTIVNINMFSGLSEISILADDNIALNTFWSLGDQIVSATLSLSAGNNINLNDGSGIQAGQNWSVNMTAGTQVTSKTQVTPGNGGIYLNGNAFIQAANGDINLSAANEVVVNGGAIRTVGGGNIYVTAEYGNVNSGINTLGYDYWTTAPYYMPDPNLGGIGTAAGGDVTINAGGDVNSFSATTVAAGDPGTGAFDPTKPGSVTVNAGGNVYGHFVVANGSGTISSGQDIGTALQNVSLSLVNGGWNLNAPNGNIYLQEVRNPNGVFDNLTHQVNRRSAPTPGNHLFDYNQQALVALTAGNAVYLTGFDLPRPNDPVPMLLPPTVIINAGPGGVVLDTPSAIDAQGNSVTLSSDYGIILFPSPFQSLQITTTGGGWLSSGNAGGIDASLLMSDSGLTQWYNAAVSGGTLPFGPLDHASAPALLNNDEPVMINLTGSQMVNGIPVLAGMENIILQTDKATQINIAGDMIGCSFYGENLQASGPGSMTSITVGGQIYNAGSFTSVTLNQGFPALPSADTPLASGIPAGTSLTSWYLALSLAVDPNSTIFSKSYSDPSQLASLLAGARLFGGLNISSLAYNPDTKTLTAIGPMSPDLLAALQSPTVAVVRYGANGYPLLDSNGHFVLDAINWVPGGSANAASISSLYSGSQGTVPLNGAAGAYVVGGTGEFDVTAGSISLGNSRGILSVGNGGTLNSQFLNHAYSFLTPYITSGANISVKVNANPAIPDATGSLEMPASTIASLGGGNVTVDCEGEIPNSPLNNSGVGISMDLGSQELLGFEAQISTVNNLGLGIYAAGPGDVNVTALGTINIDSSRIATFNGGNVTVTSKTGDVNAGTGGASVVPIQYFAPNYFGNNPVEYVPANGIVAGTLTAARQIPVGAVQLPGNITVNTPQGSIYADLGGISQVAYDETLSAADDNTAINLSAGTPAGGDWSSKEPPTYTGDIILGSSGVIGVNVNAKATGTVTGRIFSQGNANVSGQTIGNLLVVAGGKADVSSQNGSTGPITIVAVGGVNANGIGPATLISSSVNGGAGTLATFSSASSASQSATGQTSAENQKQVASDASATDDDKKKKKTDLVRTAGRVTVVLPKSS